ncbi:MAG: ATP-binding cassette domain-containing protein [Ilumatobacteraceae bacterium]
MTTSVSPSAPSPSPAQLSGGEAARAGLAALLLSRFDVYLLDEPTNDLDLDGLDRLERWVLGLDAPVLLVSHDRRFLDRVVTDVAEIDEFSHRVDRYGGGWQAYLDERERARQHAWERFEAYDAERTSLARRPNASGSGHSRDRRRCGARRATNPTRTSAPSGSTRPSSWPARPHRPSGRSTGSKRSTSRASRGSSGSTSRRRNAVAPSSPTSPEPRSTVVRSGSGRSTCSSNTGSGSPSVVATAPASRRSSI